MTKSYEMRPEFTPSFSPHGDRAHEISGTHSDLFSYIDLWTLCYIPLDQRENHPLCDHHRHHYISHRNSLRRKKEIILDKKHFFI